jgi:hypothetical protein
MATNFLTQQDVYNYGEDMISLTQRAAAQAFAPHLQALDQQNAELRRQMAIEQRRRLDADLAAAVPNYQEIDADPRWLQWLAEPDPLSGATRQQVLDDAIRAGSASRVVAFFNTFQQMRGDAAHPARSRPRSAAVQQGEVLTRARIAELYELHRKGKLVGPEWERTEQQIIAAAAAGNVVGALEPRGR